MATHQMKTSLLKYKRSKYKTVRHKTKSTKASALTDHRTSLRVPFFSLGTGKNMLTMANEMYVGGQEFMIQFVFG